MTPQEKAQELVDKFKPHVLQKDFFGDSVEHDKAKECALLAVADIFSLLIDNMNSYDSKYSQGAELYWIEVKHEIEQL